MDQQRLLPIAMEDSLVAFTGRLVGIALLVLVGLMWACLVTWSSADPSLTHTTAGKAQNFMGSVGAVVSDLLLQTLGLATVLILLPPMIWSLELIKIGRVPGFGTKISFFPLAVLILSGAMSSAPAFGNWPLANGLGGILGDLFFSFGAGLLAALSPERATLATAILLTGLGFSALAGSIGLRAHELLGLLWNVRSSQRMREIAGTWEQSLWGEAKRLARQVSAPHPQMQMQPQPAMWAQPAQPTSAPPMMPPSFERAASSDIPGAIEPTLPDPHGVLRSKDAHVEAKVEQPAAPQPPMPVVQVAPVTPAPAPAPSSLLQIEPLPLTPAAEPASAPASAPAAPAPWTEPAKSHELEPEDREDDDLDPAFDLEDDEDDGSLAIARRFAPASAQARAAAKSKASEPRKPVRSRQPVKAAPANAPASPANAAPAAKSAKPFQGLMPPRKPAAPSRPSLNLLEPQQSAKLAPDTGHAAVKERAAKLVEALALYGVNGEVRATAPGPVLTVFEFEPARGVKASRVISLADDIARCMGVSAARVATLPGRSALTIELPNARRETVQLRHVLESGAFRHADGVLPVALGRSISGDAVVVDLASLPSLVIAGAPEGGKSAMLQTILLSLLYRHSAEDLQLVLIDPRRSDLAAFDGIAHLAMPVATDADQAPAAIAWLRNEFEERQKHLSRLNARSIDVYNRRVRNAKGRGERFERVVQTGFDRSTGSALYESQHIDAEPLPEIVVMVSELAALPAGAKRELELLLRAVTPLSRSLGIHLVLATELPVADTITPVIKACEPARLSLRLTSRSESRAFLGEEGAEQLLAHGDMLYASGSGQVLRIHAPAVTAREVDGIARFLRSEMAPKLAS